MLVKLIRKLVAGATDATEVPSSEGRKPDSADQTDQLRHALQCYEAGDIAAARILYGQILRRDENNLEAQYYLGVILGRVGECRAAEELLRKVIAKQPQSADALNALGNVAKMQEHWEDAEVCYNRALMVEPVAPTIWSNLGLCLREAGHTDAAETALRRALDLMSDSPEALLNLAMIATDTGKENEARQLLQRVLAFDPNMAEAHTGLAHLLLQNGEFATGWQEYEWRFNCADAERQREYPFPRWDGAPIKDEVLLLRAEQGLGDQIMFASCLPDAIERARLCWVECEPRLVGLFARSFPDARFYPYYPKREPQWAGESNTPAYQIHLGSLPGLFRRQQTDFPRRRYLRADPVRVERWRTRLLELGAGCKVGISWRGGAPRTRRSLRSLALAEWGPILRQEGAVFISLQYGDCRGELDAWSQTGGPTIHHWPDAIDDYAETAALVAALDQVISVQTAVVHLAGAQGKPAWVLVPATPEWRYMAQGEVMPWYPSVTLVRQRERGNWHPVIARIAALLASEVRTRESVISRAWVRRS